MKIIFYVAQPDLNVEVFERSLKAKDYNFCK